MDLEPWREFWKSKVWPRTRKRGRWPIRHLESADPELAPLFVRFPGERIQGSGDPFRVLANAIVGQQISVKAAAAIFGRVTVLLGEWTPAAVARVTDQQLRTAGLSARKVEYFRGLAEAFSDGPRGRGTVGDGTRRRGVEGTRVFEGDRSVDGRNVSDFPFEEARCPPLDDLGLLQSAARWFGWDYPFDPKILAARAETWRPWRTVAVWYLWRALDPEPVVY